MECDDAHEVEAAEVSAVCISIDFIMAYLWNQDGNDIVMLDLNSTGQLFAKSQVTDYMCWGDGLANYNMLNFFVDTYEEDIPHYTRCSDGSSDSENSDDDRATAPQGRPCHDCFPYLGMHPKVKQKQRVKRYWGHRNLPNFVGWYFPWHDDPEIYLFYCMCMLILLKPWCNLQHDLKSPEQTWPAAFEQFLDHANEWIKFIFSGIQYFHDCEAAAKESCLQEDFFSSNGSCHHNGNYEVEVAEAELGEGIGEEAQSSYSKEGLVALSASQTSVQEKLHGHLAVEIAKQAKFFTSTASEWQVSGTSTMANAMGDDLIKLMAWKTQMKQDVLAQDLSTDEPHHVDPPDGGWVKWISNPTQTQGGKPEVSVLAAEASLPPVDLSLLKFDQFWVYDIIQWHLKQQLSWEDLPPLHMIVYGEGRTGKSKVIQTVTEAFTCNGAKYMLVKSTYTGVAVSLIDGKMTHTLVSLSMASDGSLSDESKLKLQRMWQLKEYLVIDEYSMISKTFFALLSKNIGIGRQGAMIKRNDYSFGEVNVILCSDLHQFPPVTKVPSQYLYQPTDISWDSMETQIGRTIYEEFRAVVMLKEQMWVTDPI